MKFQIRDILWLTILVAVAVAWWLDNRATTRRLDELHNQVQFERFERESQQASIAVFEAMVQIERAKAEQALLRLQHSDQGKLFYEDQPGKSP